MKAAHLPARRSQAALDHAASRDSVSAINPMKGQATRESEL